MMILLAEYNQVIDGLRMQLTLQRRLSQELLEEKGRLKMANDCLMQGTNTAERLLALDFALKVAAQSKSKKKGKK